MRDSNLGLYICLIFNRRRGPPSSLEQILPDPFQLIKNRHVSTKFCVKLADRVMIAVDDLTCGASAKASRCLRHNLNVVSTAS